MAGLHEHIERYRANQILRIALVDTVKYAALRRGSRCQLEFAAAACGAGFGS
ncbi:hypothetical protein ACFW6F_22145 [Streptomyces sp. NPDC058746]|uniref:hypothetical protein n=1 Tax=Streptomyces sp. NPDC058746 TaxID=3346622 RepID=UPI003690740D